MWKFASRQLKTHEILCGSIDKYFSVISANIIRNFSHKTNANIVSGIAHETSMHESFFAYMCVHAQSATWVLFPYFIRWQKGCKSFGKSFIKTAESGDKNLCPQLYREIMFLFVPLSSLRFYGSTVSVGYFDFISCVLKTQWVSSQIEIFMAVSDDNLTIFSTNFSFTCKSILDFIASYSEHIKKHETLIKI